VADCGRPCHRFRRLLLVALPGGGGRGAALSLVAAAAVTAGTLLSRRLAGLDVVAATGWHLLIGGVALAGVARLVEGPPAIVWTPRFVLSLAFLSLIGTAATTVAWFIEGRRTRLDALTAWTFLTPVVGLVLAMWVLSERPARWSAVGLAASLVAMWVALRSPRASRTDEWCEAAMRVLTSRWMWAPSSPLWLVAGI
jgi:probable blue pigment (indigoidine) exporter